MRDTREWLQQKFGALDESSQCWLGDVRVEARRHFLPTLLCGLGMAFARGE